MTTQRALSSETWTLRYHVPRSQVWEGSRGRQSGAVHLHAVDEITVTAKRGRCGTLTRAAGRSLCGKHGWYERPVKHDSDLQLRCAECERRATRYGIDWPTPTAPTRLQGTCQRTLEIRVDVAAEISDEPPTRYVRITGQGPRGGVAALGLYLSPRVEDLQRFAAGARLVATHRAWLSIIAYNDGTLRIEREPGRRAGWLRVRFRTTQGRVAWTDLLPPDVSDELLQALENAATHLAGATA